MERSVEQRKPQEVYIRGKLHPDGSFHIHFSGRHGIGVIGTVNDQKGIRIVNIRIPNAREQFKRGVFVEVIPPDNPGDIQLPS